MMDGPAAEAEAEAGAADTAAAAAAFLGIRRSLSVAEPRFRLFGPSKEQ